MDKIKEKVLQAKNLDELFDVEEEEHIKFRNNLYNELLKDEMIKKHIFEITGADDNDIDNILFINGSPPIDYFDEDDE